jgi:glyoxylase-like metal-dependent hydrolase (beta-lactamase superfamily II)
MRINDFIFGASVLTWVAAESVLPPEGNEMSLIRPTRRDVMKLAASAPALALPAALPQAARANVGPPAGENPALFRFTLGQARLTILSDGYFTLPAASLGINANEADVRAFLEQYFQSTEVSYAHTNHLLIELGDAKVLVDVGSGARFMPTTGLLGRHLEQAGLELSDITHVALTHAHPDHIWGVRDDFDEPMFADAAHFIAETEYAYWMQDGLVNQVRPDMQQFVVGAVNSLTTEGLEWTMVADGAEIAPGIRMIATPGHTPGHMSVLVESEGEQLIALGDSMSNAFTNFVHPTWYNGSDIDGDQTVTTRQRLLDMAAADRITLVGYHFPFPGVGHVLRTADAYQFVPALWQF